MVQIKNPFGSLQTNPKADAWWVPPFFLKKSVFVKHPRFSHLLNLSVVDPLLNVTGYQHILVIGRWSAETTRYSWRQCKKMIVLLHIDTSNHLSEINSQYYQVPGNKGGSCSSDQANTKILKSFSFIPNTDEFQCYNKVWNHSSVNTESYILLITFNNRLVKKWVDG